MPPRGKRAGSASRDDSRRDRASRSGRQGVASSDDSDDEPDPPAEEAQPGNLQPLDKEDLTRLVERFASLGFPLPKKIRNLSNEDARCAYNQHMATWGLAQRETPHARGPLQPRVFVHRPPMENCEYHRRQAARAAPAASRSALAPRRVLCPRRAPASTARSTQQHLLPAVARVGGGVFLGFWGVVMIFWGCGVVLVGVGGIGLKKIGNFR